MSVCVAMLPFCVAQREDTSEQSKMELGPRAEHLRSLRKSFSPRDRKLAVHCPQCVPTKKSQRDRIWNTNAQHGESAGLAKCIGEA